MRCLRVPALRLLTTRLTIQVGARSPAAREVGDDLDSPQSKVSPQPAAVVLHSWYLTFNKRAGGAPGRGYATLEKTPARPGDPPAEAVLWPTTMAGIRMLDAFEGEGTHYKRELWEVAVVRLPHH